MREEFFSKFIDYNNRLEKILETKDFSLDVKNLLLSMLYKIDMSYSDYQTVKRNVKNKQDFLENIIRIIENCENIELIKPNSEDGFKFEEEGIKYKVNPLTYEIKSLENEKEILEALFELDNDRFYLPEKYNLIRVAFPDILNQGRAIGNVEIIRDFNAWSWNVLATEINNFYANIIYQNLEILIGQEELENWIIEDEIEDKIEWITEKLEEKNPKEEVSKFLNLIYQNSINCCVNNNSIEKKRLLDEKIILEEEYKKLINKEKYLEEITQIKKDKHKEVERIDKILNDNKLLKEEYKIRNQQLKEYNKIFDIYHLVQILNKQRTKELNEIAEYNELLQPYKYLEKLDKIKQQLSLLQYIEKEQINRKVTENKIIELEEIFLTFFKENIKQASKKEILEYAYMVRYYKKIPFSEEKALEQITQLSGLLEEIEEIIINKMYELKQINKISEDKNFNIKVLKNIFDKKIINLENIYIQIKKQEDKCKVELYDKEILEKEILLDTNEKIIKEFKIKTNKMIKIFV